MGILRCLTISAAAALLVACDHPTPFSAGSYGNTGPLFPGNPAQLTYNTGVDTRASWLPDGSGFLYTQEQVGRTDLDRCFALMPAGGGTVTRTICAGDQAEDSLDDVESAAVSTDGRIVYARTSMVAGYGHSGPDNAALVIATFANPLAATVLQTIPYFGPASRSVDMVSDIHWTGPSTLVFLTEQWSYPAACGRCTNVDTVRTGLDIQRIDLGPPPVISLIPGTDQATSVTAGGRDTIYYTLAGDPGVHRRILATNADTVVFTFTSAPTDVTFAGSELAAVVADTIHVVNLQTNADAKFPVGVNLVVRPALSPDGHSLVAEVAVVDTLGIHPTDLWLWRLP